MIIRTSRLLLRPAFPEDAGELHAAFAEEGIVRMLASAPWPYLPEHAAEFCAQPFDANAIRFVVALPGADGAPIIGGVGIDTARDEPELGYWIAQGYRRQGYATEAANTVLDVAALLGFPMVASGHWADNAASGGVLRAVGFVETGELRPEQSLGRGGEVVQAVRYVCDLRDRSGMRLAA